MLFGKKTSGVTWIVAFLGNPGPKYAGTRHNVGFMTADVMEKKLDIKINKLRFRALTAQCGAGGEKLLLMKPQSYMNLSGEAVGAAAKFYKIPASNVLVVADDVALPVGKLRIRTKGSAGGHNGLKSIISALGGEDFPRIKIGVGAPAHPEHEMVDWVLGTFKGREAEDIAAATAKAADAVLDFIRYGADEAMNRYN